MFHAKHLCVATGPVLPIESAMGQTNTPIHTETMARVRDLTKRLELIPEGQRHFQRASNRHRLSPSEVGEIALRIGLRVLVEQHGLDEPE